MQLEDQSDVSAALLELWDLGRVHGQEYAARLRAIAPFWTDPDPDDPSQQGLHELEVATALRCSLSAAGDLLRTAHTATSCFPRLLELMSQGAFPVGWFDATLRRTRSLAEPDRLRADEEIATWDLGISHDRFRRELGYLIEWLAVTAEDPVPPPESSCHRVELQETHEPGALTLAVTGPIPDVLSFSQRLDATARAVQDAQRRAIASGDELPLDPDGIARGRGYPLSLNRIRHQLLMSARFDTEGVRVPAERFRITVTVPALTLMGCSTLPALLGGTIPIPAEMARDLAAGEQFWQRVLTDPVTAQFLPLPATTYTPPRAMLEHLRLRNATCAVPGCDRPTRTATECDHIEEYDHADPEAGGRTEIENLHLLCRAHHRMKTDRHIDPRRPRAPDEDRDPHAPRGTLWHLGPDARMFTPDDTDLATPHMVRALTTAWDEHVRQRQRYFACRADDPSHGQGDGSRPDTDSDTTEGTDPSPDGDDPYAGPTPF
ncbi:MAG: DUF222 domain-containing protein [Brachybacterium sp.]|nr:DUF222 domain-containing protein [Brachybacterium sp.]